jgi:hypothetical protein
MPRSTRQLVALADIVIDEFELRGFAAGIPHRMPKQGRLALRLRWTPGKAGSRFPKPLVLPVGKCGGQACRVRAANERRSSTTTRA